MGEHGGRWGAQREMEEHRERSGAGTNGVTAREMGSRERKRDGGTARNEAGRDRWGAEGDGGTAK